MMPKKLAMGAMILTAIHPLMNDHRRALDNFHFNGAGWSRICLKASSPEGGIVPPVFIMSLLVFFEIERQRACDVVGYSGLQTHDQPFALAHSGSKVRVWPPCFIRGCPEIECNFLQDHCGATGRGHRRTIHFSGKSCSRRD